MLGNLLLTTSLRYYSGDSGDMIIVVALLGIGLMIFGFMKFRYGGEVIEGKKAGIKGMDFNDTLDSLKDSGLIRIPGMR